MTSKKTLEYCAPEVKEIMLSNEGLICGSFGADDVKKGRDDWWDDEEE